MLKDSKLHSKEERLDEQFRSLLDQSNRSKHNIDVDYPPKTTTDRIPSTLTSPTRDLQPVYSSIPKSPDYTKYDTTKFDSTLGKTSSNIQTADYSTQRIPNVATNKLEREIHDLKSTVLERIRRQEAETQAQIAENRKASRKANIVSLSSLNSTTQLEEDTVRTVASKPNARSDRSAKSHRIKVKSPEKKGKKQHGEHTTAKKTKKAEKSKSKAKSKLDDDEPDLREKYIALKHKAKEMRTTLQQYVENYSDLETLLDKKDRVLIEYEEQIKQSQQELLKNFEMMQEMKRNEEIAIKGHEDLRVQNTEMKTRIQDQAKKLDELEVQVKRNEEKYHTQLESLRHEKHELMINLKDREEKADQLASLNEKYRSEADLLQREFDKSEAYAKKLQAQNEKSEEELKDLRERVEKLQAENKEYYLACEELKENKAHLEEKLAKYKKRTEEEQAKWETERGKELEHKREKNKQLKANIKELEGMLQRAIDEKKQLAHDFERTLLQKSQLDKELCNLREELLVAHQET